MNRPRVTSRPQTAMELAFNRAVQEFATRKSHTPPPRTTQQQPAPKKQ